MKVVSITRIYTAAFLLDKGEQTKTGRHTFDCVCDRYEAGLSLSPVYVLFSLEKIIIANLCGYTKFTMKRETVSG